MLTRVPVN